MERAGMPLYRFEIVLDAPLDVAGSLERFRRWGDDLLDRWDGQTLVRTAPMDGTAVPYACAVVGTIDQPRVTVAVAEPAQAEAVERAVRAMWVAAPDGALAALVAADPVIASLEARYRGIWPIVQTDGVAALVRSISAQQVNLRWAVTTRRRLAEALGLAHRLGPHLVYSLPAARLATANEAQLRALQFTTRKAEYIIAIAQSVLDGALDLQALAAMPDAEVVERLMTVRGIGRWTAEWYLARTLGRPVVVAGDLGVRKAVGAAYLDGALPSEPQVRELTAHWGEAACVAQELLLYALNQGNKPSAPPPPRETLLR
jgi:DNA-3-methyladenine glycosylase II